MPHVQCFTNSCILILWKTCFHVITAWKRQHWNVVSEKELVVPFCPSVSLSVEIWLSALWSHSLYICLTFSFVLLVTFTFCGLASIQCPGVVSVGQWWSMCDWKMSFRVCVVIIWRVLTGIAMLLISALKKKKTRKWGGLVWKHDELILTDTFVFSLRVTDEPERISRSPVTRWELISIFPTPTTK